MAVVAGHAAGAAGNERRGAIRQERPSFVPAAAPQPFFEFH